MNWRKTQRSSCFRGETPICLFQLPFHPICGAFSSSYKSLSSYHPPIPCPAIVWDKNCPTFWCQPQKMAPDSHTAQHGAWQGLYRVMWNPWTSAHFPRIFTLPFTTHRIWPHICNPESLLQHQSVSDACVRYLSLTCLLFLCTFAKLQFFFVCFITVLPLTCETVRFSLCPSQWVCSLNINNCFRFVYILSDNWSEKGQ